ncbi:arabinogalactan protein [Cystoisospora suis]|uniref:Arabinogalactan protein n=1 Tax=Cystoisospora suis TaxID=483139 RepID=A0A2C6KJC8_9APIC|nr:arabinogalactan protein [Cystoisospora suis]
MAVNPVLAQDASTKETFPLPLPGEVFFLKRGHIDFKLTGPTNLKASGGEFFLSSRRIVFVRKGDVSKHKDFSSFELPLHLVTEPKFEQPIFGANYMRGKVQPLESSENPISGTSKWSLTFNAGGCGTFLNVFYKLWQYAVKHQPPSPDLVQQLHLGASAAFVDPNDPSTIYVTQPVPASPPPAPAAPTGIPAAYQQAPPPGAYPPLGGGYAPPPQGAYPPPQGAYPPPQGAYPSQGAYPPPQGAYPPPQGAYPPQPFYYPPPGAPYPPPQPGSPSPPQQGGVQYPPPSGGQSQGQSGQQPQGQSGQQPQQQPYPPQAAGYPPAGAYPYPPPAGAYPAYPPPMQAPRSEQAQGSTPQQGSS